MTSTLLQRIDTDETWRREAFPACRKRIFMAHAAVTAIPQVAVSAMNAFNETTSTGELDYSDVLLNQMDRVRVVSAKIIACDSNEVALLGPTSLGLSLVANGIEWKSGDEVITYLDDYPANVYPWKHLEKQGVKVVYLKPALTGEITPELVRRAITPKTRLLALASCHFLSGYRLDIEAIGTLAKERDLLFCLDAIQTVGAFPTPAGLVDFLCADSHKWMLGPMTAGIFYVAKKRQEHLHPSLLGAWNVKSPNFIAQDKVDFEPGGRRYEPGVLNAQGLVGMEASLELLTGIGIESISKRLLELKTQLITGIQELGFEVIGPQNGSSASSITSVTDLVNPRRIPELYDTLAQNQIVVSFRHDRKGTPFVRFSPHFYNTSTEIEQILDILRKA
ncbi:MAG: aminotransferase class V-fold PLP-dependent enzyme [Verrucomicrobiales bacterium]|jgi:cysteine desulfurase/selenocysteine lyase|nr:aminotransferase class V-fold PLP-dependent enzyme [Verrucomicrobiales bacterium]HQZ27173.1 aminotransferase class V-fold PLP-dependent enzyme [Verrucomicrobiales bacterium]